jgi:hypothetical protein
MKPLKTLTIIAFSLILLLNSCGSDDATVSISGDFNGTYNGELSGKLCNGSNVSVDVTHIVKEYIDNDEERVFVTDQDGNVYEGGVTLIVRPEGNFYGFYAPLQTSNSGNPPVAIGYDISGLASQNKARVYVDYTSNATQLGCNSVEGILDRKIN